MPLLFDPQLLQLDYRSRDGVTWPVNRDRALRHAPETTYRVDRFRLEVSLSCDLQCDYCIVFMNKIAKPVRRMSLDTAKRIMEEFNETVGASGDMVIIGGEPLLNWPVVEYFVAHCPGKVLLFTNLLAINGDQLDFLKEHGTRILTSLDGYSREQNSYRFHSTRKDELEITVRNIREAARRGCDLGIACLVTDRNVGDLNAIADYFCDDIGCRSFSFAYSHYLLHGAKVGSYPFEDYISAICSLFDHAKRKRFYVDQTGRILRGILWKENCLVGCKAGTSQRTFYPDGSETICTKLDLIGKRDIREIATLFPQNNPACQDCIARQLCGGGCLWDSQTRPGPSGVDPRLCASKRAFTEYILQDIEKELDACPTAVLKEGRALDYLSDIYAALL